MPFKRQERILGAHGAPVVHYPDFPAASIEQADRNPGALSVYAVFDKLFYHCGRTFDDFAGGDLVA
jgi:hypothetical protein